MITVIWEPFGPALPPVLRQKLRAAARAKRDERYNGAALREIRARNGVGRPPKTRKTATLLDMIHSAMCAGMSQRKAAVHLGISIGKLQRELRKAA